MVSDSNSVDRIYEPLSKLDVFSLRGRVVLRCEAYDRFERESRQERDRIQTQWARCDWRRQHIFKDQDLYGKPGVWRMDVMTRHCIKKRWKDFDIWDAMWGVPHRGNYVMKDTANWRWKWERKQDHQPRGWDETRLPGQPLDVEAVKRRQFTWPPRDQERPDERAIRQHLTKQDKWPHPPPTEAERHADELVDSREKFLSTRPWLAWEIDVEEEHIRLTRINRDGWSIAPENVKARWKALGQWKDNWGELPGWKWKHESPSPEPPDLDHMDFTPSEIDALDAAPLPTPPPPQTPTPPGGWPPIPPGVAIFALPPPPPFPEARTDAAPRDSDDDQLMLAPVNDNRRMNNHTLETTASGRPTGRSSRPRRNELSPPELQRTRRARGVPPSSGRPQGILKPFPAPLRRSARIAERCQRLKTAEDDRRAAAATAVRTPRVRPPPPRQSRRGRPKACGVRQ